MAELREKIGRCTLSCRILSIIHIMLDFSRKMSSPTNRQQSWCTVMRKVPRIRWTNFSPLICSKKCERNCMPTTTSFGSWWKKMAWNCREERSLHRGSPINAMVHKMGCLYLGIDISIEWSLHLSHQQISQSLFTVLDHYLQVEQCFCSAIKQVGTN